MTRPARQGACAVCAAVLLAGCTSDLDEVRARGILAFQRGDLYGAERTLGNVLDRSPGDAQALYYMGRVCHARGQIVRAMYHYQCCLDAYPAHEQARVWLAKAQRQAGDIGRDLRFIPD